MATVNYSWNLPTVGGDEDAWGGQLNANWTALDTLLGGVSQTEFAILNGATVTTAELNILDGVTATAAELNILDGVTATAAELNLLDGVTALPRVPAGAVIWHAANTPPTGYLKANGALVSRTTYADLFTAIGTTFGAGDGSTTFALPDLRGEFLRGWDDARGIDSGRLFGSAQADAFQGHHHNFAAFGQTAGGGGGFSGLSGTAGAGGIVINPITDGANGTPRTAAETRPRNIALLACIKF